MQNFTYWQKSGASHPKIAKPDVLLKSAKEDDIMHAIWVAKHIMELETNAQGIIYQPCEELLCSSYSPKSEQS